MTDAASRRILVVDDEPGVRESMRILLGKKHEIVVAESGEDALERLERDPVDVALLDILMPGMDGLECLERIRAHHPHLPVVMLTATKTVKTAVSAMKLGAFDYLTKPFDVEEIQLVIDRATEKAALEREVERLRNQVRQSWSGSRVVGNSAEVARILDTVRTMAPLKTTVLIRGESGTGKELVARALHGEGPRSAGPWVVLNCAAIPENLVESELFGHERGAFTDAHARKSGLFEQAHRGTLFLDEIGEMPIHLQAKLLRVLEEERVTRVGGTVSIPVDVRVVAATNRDLSEAIEDGSFRADLFYRLNVVSIELPPLRRRPADIALLADHFIEEKRNEHRRPAKTLSSEALALLERYEWPGNVRELENAIERAVILSGDRSTLEPADFDSLTAGRSRTARRGADPLERVLDGRQTLSDVVDEIEVAVIREALERASGNQTRAAKLLGTTRRILKYKIDKLRLDSGG